MKLIEVARQQRDLLNEGIAYIAVWQETQKNGKRSWFTEDIFPADTDKEDPIFDEEQKARLAEIAALDSDAVLLNGYYHAWIGSADEPLNATSIAKGIENHYLMHNALISGYLADESETPAADETAENGEDLDYGEAQHYPGRYAKPDAPMTEAMQKQIDEYFESLPSEEPETITIELPAVNIKEDILRALIESKATLIKAALGEDGTGELPIEFSDGKVKFKWLRFGVESDAVKAWSTFLAAAVKFSKTAKRITAKDEGVDENNSKFQFRVFCVKLGMNGVEHKWARKYLLRNLKGSSSFATQESADRWNAKHNPKKTTEEGKNNDISE